MSHCATSSSVAKVFLALMVALASAAPAAAAPTDERFRLGPPEQEGPVVVRAHFDLQDVNEISDGTETFEFSGVLTLEWRDSREAFDPAVAGVPEKTFLGDYQFNELATGWYPQVILVNVSGLYEKSGVVLRIQPDGTCTLIESVNGIAEGDFNMRLFPFDSQRLEAVFGVLGFDRDEVVLEVDADAAHAVARGVRVPQWKITGASLTVRDRPLAAGGAMSALILRIDVDRESWFARRLVVAPLVVIVLLSFSVFWMDRSSLGDRLSVSFIGILTVVAYQLVTSEHLPRISYMTVIHAFLNLSFLTMCATVVVNLVVGTLDRRGRPELAERIDRHCRWAFPVVYFGLNGLLLAMEVFSSGG